MKYKYLTALFLVFFSVYGIAQPAETIYSGNLVVSGYTDNQSYGPYNIGFNFTFFGNSYSQFYVNSNGMITFGAASAANAEAVIPTAAAPNNYIAAMWDDLIVDPFGNILYSVIGSAPNRKLVVQYRNMGFYGSAAYLGTFSIILYETSNNIQVQYRTIVSMDDPRATGNSALIGLENSTGTAGKQYSFQTAGSVASGKSLLFTPNGPGYDLNSDAIYDGIYLTTNITQPEPGITEMISPDDHATVGTSVTFEWAPTAGASSYRLEVATNPSLVGSTAYYPGTATTYNVSGLISGTNYYWTLFTSNSTGNTWNEIRKFTASSTPPLSAVPRTLYVEQGSDNTIKLNYTGGDAGAKTATITAIPPNGQLYQYNAGVKGALINSVPTVVTDPSYNVIYAANGSYGNNAGNFKFTMTDGTGTSPEALVTVNVSPPGIPNLLYVAKSTTVEMQFDRLMANPAGKESQFTVTVNSSPVTVSGLALKTGDPYTIVATLATPLTGSETVSVAYTAGDVASAQGGWLASFSDLPVTLRAQTITFTTNLDKKYSDAPFVLSATSNSGLSFTFSSSNLAIATIAGSTLTIRGLGTSEITARQAGNATWAPARYVRTLTVAKGDQVITFGSLTPKTWGDIDFTLSASSTSGLAVSFTSDNNLVATVTGNTVHITGAGTATITASQAGNTLWNPAPDVQRTLTVNKANQTITFDEPPAKTYLDPDFNLGATSSSGLTVSYAADNPAVATITGNTVHITGAGTTIITASQAGDGNYNPAPDVLQALLVNKAGQTITFGTLPVKTYGDVDFTLNATSTSGLAVEYSGDNPIVADVSGNSVHITSAGSVNITAAQPGDANFNPATAVIQGLTVNKATLTFTADNLSKEYNAPVPGLTFAITGFVNNEDQSVLDNIPLIQTTATASSPVGSYPITLSGGNDNNYAFVLVNGTLTVTGLSQTITLSRVPEKLLVADTFKIIASSSSGLALSFESLDPDLVSVNGNIVKGLEKGFAQVRVYNDGNINYMAVSETISFEVYSTHKDIMSLFTPNNDGINDYWELPKMSEWGVCSVKVYDRRGKLVYDNKNYDNLWDGTSNGAPLPEGAYYYIIDSENNGVVKGTVNVVR